MIPVPVELLLIAAVVAWVALFIVALKSEPHRIVPTPSGEWCEECGEGVLCREAVQA
jgi:hypothetical protein